MEERELGGGGGSYVPSCLPGMAVRTALDSSSSDHLLPGQEGWHCAGLQAELQGASMLLCWA